METRISEQESLKYCEQTRSLYSKINVAYLELGKRLIKIKNENLAESQYGGFDIFLSEIGIKKSTSEHLMRVYQKFVLDYGIKEESIVEAGGYTRVYELLPLARTKEEAIEVLEHAKTLPSRESIKSYVKEAMGKTTTACNHEEVYILEVCKCCNGKVLVGEKTR